MSKQINNRLTAKKVRNALKPASQVLEEEMVENWRAITRNPYVDFTREIEKSFLEAKNISSFSPDIRTVFRGFQAIEHRIKPRTFESFYTTSIRQLSARSSIQDSLVDLVKQIPTSQLPAVKHKVAKVAEELTAEAENLPEAEEELEPKELESQTERATQQAEDMLLEAKKSNDSLTKLTTLTQELVRQGDRNNKWQILIICLMIFLSIFDTLNKADVQLNPETIQPHSIEQRIKGKEYIVDGTGVRVRNAPGTEDTETLDYLKDREEVFSTKSAKDPDGDLWLYLPRYKGWTHSDFLKPISKY